MFSDRAEVTRLFEIDVEVEGQYELVMEGLTEHVNLDSLRVKGRGDCKILEVGSPSSLVWIACTLDGMYA